MSVRTIVTKADIEVPRPPNFFIMSVGVLPVSAVSDDDLREIGAAWTEALIERAAEQRKESEDD